MGTLIAGVCALLVSLVCAGPTGRMPRSKTVSYTKGTETYERIEERKNNKFETFSTTTKYFRNEPSGEEVVFRVGSPTVVLEDAVAVDGRRPAGESNMATVEEGPSGQYAVSLPSVEIPTQDINVQPTRVRVETPRFVPGPDIVIPGQQVTIPPARVNVQGQVINQGPPRIFRQPAAVNLPPELTLPPANINVGGSRVFIPSPRVRVAPPVLNTPEDLNLPAPNFSIRGPSVYVPPPQVIAPTGQRVIQSPRINVPAPNFFVDPTTINVSASRFFDSPPDIQIAQP